MKILNASIWVYNKNVHSHHRLQILVDRIPKIEEMRFECNKKYGLYFAEKEGYVKFFYWSGKGNDGGFYGSEFEITMKNGEKVLLKGAWSSRSGVMNVFFKPHCMEISITDDEDDFFRGHTFYSGAITVDLAKDIVKRFLPDWTIVKKIRFENEIYYDIVRKDDMEDKRDNEFYRKFFNDDEETGKRYVGE